VDPVSLILNALASGAAQGAADSVSDAVKSAYTKLTRLVSVRFSGSKPAEVALAEHANDPETWQAPLAKALTDRGVSADLIIIDAAQQLMALLDQTGTAEGKYQVDLQGAQGVQVGDGNQQFNTFNSVTPAFVMPPHVAEIRPGQPGNEAAFGEAFQAGGGRDRLGEAIDEVQQDGPGWVQHFDGGNSGRPAVICAPFGESAVAVEQEVWNALGRLGRGTYISGTAAVGFPVPSGERSLIKADGSLVELNGGAWGCGRLIPITGEWRWQPTIVFDSEACHDQDTGSSRHGEMDLRLRLAARMPLVAESLRVTEAGRAQMLAELPTTGLTDVIAALAKRYDLEPTDMTWQETPEPEGTNNSRIAAYQLAVPGIGGRPALLGSLWFLLPGGRTTDIRAIADLYVDFAAIQPDTGAAPAQIAPELRITASELISFYVSALQAVTALVLTTGEQAPELPPAGPTRLELYIQNRHPELSAGPRTLRTLDMVDLSVFGRTRRTQLGNLSAGVTTPLGLSAEKIGSLVRQALVTMANDFGFTAADTARI
jgi:hypothetical protein